ncbi:hypothetical protein POKO110462_00100 [Pontibacter korlensis]|uniref:PepSY domain-containing protein n=1 Tax=Pontibacter korlensis TaxID=400092 RepID=A0A0E3UVR2_9BACT|nr:hypothetical protein [Pontibacter korlensis]AKD02702.1 hypothetical protein PKOR_05640 [Pontibacter korlensis]
MKKVTILAFAFAAFGFISTEATAQSQNSPSTQQPQTEQEQQDANKQQITEEELPEGVKQALQNDALKDWQVSEIYKVAPDAAAGADAKATYEVYFTNAEQKKAIARFDETGKPVAKAATGAEGEK